MSDSELKHRTRNLLKNGATGEKFMFAAKDLLRAVEKQEEMIAAKDARIAELENLVLFDLRGEGPAMSVSHDGSVLTVARRRSDGSFAWDESHVDFDGTDADLIRAALAAAKDTL